MRFGGFKAYVEALERARLGFIRAFLIGTRDPQSSLYLVFGWVNIYHTANFKRLARGCADESLNRLKSANLASF